MDISEAEHRQAVHQIIVDALEWEIPDAMTAIALALYFKKNGLPKPPSILEWLAAGAIDKNIYH